jgi:excinuclease ABC subunit B
MDADTVTESMARAIGETRRRREMQIAYNLEHGIEPRSVRREIRDILSMIGATEETKERVKLEKLPRDVALKTAAELERKMREYAANLEFERAAALRDELIELRKQIGGNEGILFGGKAPKIFDKALAELVGN